MLGAILALYSSLAAYWITLLNDTIYQASYNLSRVEEAWNTLYNMLTLCFYDANGGLEINVTPGKSCIKAYSGLTANGSLYRPSAMGDTLHDCVGSACLITNVGIQFSMQEQNTRLTDHPDKRRRRHCVVESLRLMEGKPNHLLAWYRFISCYLWYVFFYSLSSIYSPSI